MAAVNHPPRPRSTTPCADQPQPRPDHRISSSPQPAPTSPCLDSIQKRGGHTNFRQRRPLFSHSPQGRGLSEPHPITASKSMAADHALLATFNKLGLNQSVLRISLRLSSVTNSG